MKFLHLSLNISLANAENINCIMPCDLQSNTANIAMGNHIAHISLNLPLHIEGNIPTLWSFNDNTKRMKQNADYATMFLFNYISYLLFPIGIGKFEELTMRSQFSVFISSLLFSFKRID